MASVPKRRKVTIEQKGAPYYMTTFSDMITLMLVFFVLIYSFSVLDVEKFKAFLASFQGVGILTMGPQPLEGESIQEGQEERPLPPPAPNMEAMLQEEQRIRAEIMQVFNQLQSFLAEAGLTDVVEVRMEDRGVALDIKERILFDTGKADLKPEALPVLDRLAQFFQKIPYQISVEGHTDSRPIHTIEFPSNWELSSARSARVVRYLASNHNLDPRRFAAVGFGEFRPVAPNNSEENMALNRRVVMVIHIRDVYGSEVQQRAPDGESGQPGR